MTTPLIILGTGGSAHDVLDTLEAINARAPTWEPAGFLDDARPAGARHLGLPVLGALRDAPRFAGHAFVNAIGSDKSFRRRPALVASTGLGPERFATLVHPAASVSAGARLGQGACVHFGASVGGGAAVGDHVTVCPNCNVGHDATLGDFAVLAPAAVVSGFVRVGECCYVGAGACVRQGVALGAGALVGMGTVVLRDVPPGATVVGNPARALRAEAGHAAPAPRFFQAPDGARGCPA
jgi:sugar O-acyltransferase (sialic acid O-acetyltransferase NeuD family)